MLEAASSISRPSREERRLADFAVEFLKSYCAANNKCATLEAKESILRVHLIPDMGKLMLGEVSARTIEAYKAKELVSGLSLKIAEQQQAREVQHAGDLPLPASSLLVRDRHTSWHKRATGAAPDLLAFGPNSQVSTASNGRHASCVRSAMTDHRRLLERDIERQLRFGPKAHPPPIILRANPDAALLLDAIDLHGETCPAWETASRVGCAATSAQDATVKLVTKHISGHSPTAELRTSSPVLEPTRIGLRVNDGAVTLEGQITWNYRRDAERAIEYLSNAIGLRALNPQCSVPNVTEKVEGALRWLPTDTFKE